MNNKISRIIPVILLVMLIVVSSLFTLASCQGNEEDDTSGVTDIFFAKTGAPRKTYVVGQDLDLTTGTLTVVMDGENVPVALTTEGITVSGYDCDVIGQQEITVSYMDLSTTYTVTVIPRISPESYETDYFKGDDFNNQKGRLRVARDDGSTYLVTMNDPGVSLKSFNSANVGKADITIEYATAGATYEATFEVNVHQPESVIFHAPSNRDYRNHEELLDLTGAYFEVKAAAPSTFSKNVPLTQAMVHGYRPQDVTIANRTVPVEQTILVNYAGYSDTFTVSVLYSGVKIIQEQGARLQMFNIDFDVNLDELTLPAGAGTAALDAIKEYYALSNNDRDLIDDDIVDIMVKTATVYLNLLYDNEQEKLSDAFLMEPAQSAFMIVGTTVSAVRDAITLLENPESNFNVVTNLLRFLKDEFGTHDFNYSYTIARLISVHSDDMMTNQSKGILTALKQIDKVYSIMENFPAEWDDTTLAENKNAILDATSAIRLSTMKGPNYEFVYGVIRNWREDFFDIIYAYYFNIAENGINDIATKVWNIVPAPSKINTWYTSYLSAYNFLYSQERDGSNVIGLVYNTNTAYGTCKDLFEFHFHYNRTLTIGDEIKALGEDDVNYKMYDLLGGDEWIDVYLRCSSLGYIVLMGTGLGDEKVEKTWDTYLVLLELLYNNSGDVSKIVSHTTEFQAFTNALADMTPAQFHSFLSSLSFRYADVNASGAMYDMMEFLSSGSTKNYVTYLLANFFSSRLTNNGMTVLQQILVSMEQASLMHIKSAAKDNFISTASNLLTNYMQLPQSDKNILDVYLGDAYARCVTINTQLTGTNPSTPNASQKEKLDEINDVFNYFDSILKDLNKLAATDTTGMTDAEKAKHQQLQSDAFSILVVTFDKIDSLYRGILNATDSDTKMLEHFLYTYKYSIEVEGKDGTTTVYYTLDTRFVSARSYFISYTVGTGINNLMAWDIYTTLGLAGELAKLFPLIKSEYEMTVVDNAPDYRDIVNALTNDQVIGVYMLCGRLYSASFQRYYNSLLTDANKALEATEKLLTAENYYWIYKNSPSDEVVTEFNNNFNAVKDAYEAIQDADQKTNFENVLGDLYDLCLEYFSELNPTPEPEPEA